jgi:hypothetical protein
MRMTVTIFLCASILFSFSFKLSCQPTQNKLDQVELTKQFIGKWITQWSEETVVIWDVNSSGNGYESSINWKSEGNPIRTDPGIIGFSSDGVVTMAFRWSPDGLITCDYGKFESKKKMTTMRYDTRQGQAVMIFEYEFMSPERLKMVMKSKEADETWDQAEVSEFIFIKEMN